MMPVTAAVLVRLVRFATQATAIIRRGCRMDTRRFSITMGGGIEGIAKAEGHRDLDRPAWALRPAVLHGRRGPLLAGTEHGEAIQVGEIRKGRP
jgi:hypothetical protein